MTIILRHLLTVVQDPQTREVFVTLHPGLNQKIVGRCYYHAEYEPSADGESWKTEISGMHEVAWVNSDGLERTNYVTLADQEKFAQAVCSEMAQIPLGVDWSPINPQEQDARPTSYIRHAIYRLENGVANLVEEY